MFYIKLEEDMSLVVTVREALYRGDNLSRKLIYLIPLKVGEIDILSSCVYLNYVRADGVPDVILLERMEEKYNESYYQYTFPVNCKMTKFAGPVCTWLHFYTGDPANPITAKSGECNLQIQTAKSIDAYTCDHQLTAIYQMQKQIENGAGSGDDFWGDMDGSDDSDSTDQPVTPTPTPPSDDGDDDIFWDDMEEKEDGEIYWEDM